MPTNQPVATVAQIIHISVIDVALTAAKAALHAAVPWTNWPVVKQVIDFVLDRVIGKFCVILQEAGVFLAIMIQVESQRRAYAEAEAKLRLAHATHDPVAISAATQEFKNALRALIHYDGSVSV